MDTTSQYQITNEVDVTGAGPVDPQAAQVKKEEGRGNGLASRSTTEWWASVKLNTHYAVRDTLLWATSWTGGWGVRYRADEGYCYRHLSATRVYQLHFGAYPRLATIMCDQNIDELEYWGHVREEFGFNVHGDMMHIVEAGRGSQRVCNTRSLITWFRNPIGDSPLGLTAAHTLRLQVGGELVDLSFAGCKMLAVGCILLAMWSPVVVFQAICCLLALSLGVFWTTGWTVGGWLGTVPMIHIVTHGSRGDRVPLEYYARWLLSIGLPTSITHSTSDQDGKVMLDNVERGRFWAAAEYLTPLIALIRDRLEISDSYVVHPMTAVGQGSRCVSYDLAPPPYALKQWRMIPAEFGWNWFNWVVTFMATIGELHVRIGSFPGCAPRSADGLTLLRKRPNTGERAVLIAMGSSSEPEPTGLPHSNTWSTRVGSEYQHEVRTNHAEIFAEYRTIYSHNGAGTRATAEACGCKHIAMSNMVDRDTRDGLVFDFSGSPSVFLASVVRYMAPHHQRGVMFELIRGGHWRVARAVFVAIVSQALTSWLRFALCVVPVVIRSYALAVQQPTLFHLITCLLTPPRMTSLFGAIWATAVYSCVVFVFRRYPQMLGAQGFWLAVGVLWAHLDDAFFWLLIPSLGVPLALAATVLYRHLAGLYYYRVMIRVVQFFAYLVKGGLVDKRYIQIRFIPFVKQAGLLLPLAHVELVDPVTDAAIGVEVDKAGRTIAYRGSANTSVSLTITTNIPREEFETIFVKLQTSSGSIYNPLNTCQTALWSHLGHKGSFGMDRVILAVFITITGAVFFTAATSLTVLTGTVALIGVGGYSVTSLLTAAAPFLFLAGGGGKDVLDFYGLWLYLTSPSFNHSAPTEIRNTPLLAPVSERKGRLIGWPLGATIEIKGKGIVRVDCPQSGLHRPEYTLNRSGAHTGMIHGLTFGPNETFGYIPAEESHYTAEFERAKPLIRAAVTAFMARQGTFASIVGISAASKERPFGLDSFTQLSPILRGLIVLTNSRDGWEDSAQVTHIFLDVPGRVLAVLRVLLALPGPCQWLCLNSVVDQRIIALLPWLYAFADQATAKAFVALSPFGLHQTSAGALLLGEGWRFTISEETWALAHADTYGSDEYILLHRRGLIISPADHWLFRHLPAQMDLPINRRVIIVDGYKMLGSYVPKTWSVASHLEGLKNLETTTFSRQTLYMMGTRVLLASDENISDITDGMITALRLTTGPGTPLQPYVLSARKNLKAFLGRVENLQKNIVKEVSSGTVVAGLSSMYMGLNSLLEPFSGPTRSKKSVWAPLWDIRGPYHVPELAINLHPNPTVVRADFDATYRHYLASLNYALAGSTNRRALGTEPLDLHTFTRRVNRNPYTDLSLKQRGVDLGVIEGIDGQILASKEVMIASLARYCDSPTVRALDVGDKYAIARAIVNGSPDMYTKAHLADPKRLVAHMMKHKNYSAGFPFMGCTDEGRVRYKSRADIHRDGWMSVLADVATLPLTSGEWWPRIAHAIPKSQVIPAAKLRDNPAKLRSVVATTLVGNAEKGVMNFDVNQRHGPFAGPVKVGVPLNGTGLGLVFSQMARKKFNFSADITAHDANLSADIMDVEGEIRKIGYEHHPHGKVIAKHIDCAIEVSQSGYILNLITEPLDVVLQNPNPVVAEFINSIKPEAIEEIKLAYETADKTASDRVPGGILNKHRGGWTGDSDTTWTNSTGLVAILMVCFKLVHGIPYDRFFSEIYLANVGDDNVGGADFKPDYNAIVRVARDKLGSTIRFEAIGGPLDQVFLGKRPIPGATYESEFTRMGKPVPEFAIIHQPGPLQMRYYANKAEMTRKLGRDSPERYLYLMEKGLGYLMLTAHQPEIYKTIVGDMQGWEMYLPPGIREASWFKKKYKIPSYERVVDLWYKPLEFAELDHISRLRFSYGVRAKIDAVICEFFDTVEKYSQRIPAHLFDLGDPELLPVDAHHVTSTFMVEEHSWFQYVKRTKTAPTKADLMGLVRQSPFSGFVDIDGFMNKRARTLPTDGIAFDHGENLARNRLILTSAVYYEVNWVINSFRHLPLGVIVPAVFNMYAFAVPRMFSFLSFLHWIDRAESSVRLSQMVPKDLYYNHKAIALHIVDNIPGLSILRFLHLSSFFKGITTAGELAGRLMSLNIGLGTPPAFAPIPNSVWEPAVAELCAVLEKDNTACLTAPTATGKTRTLPQLLLNRQINGMTITRVILALPRTFLCQECPLPNHIWKKRGTAVATEPFVVATYGHLYELAQSNSLDSLLMPGTIVLFDEAHETAPETIWLYRHLTGRVPTVLLTATPDNAAYGGNPQVVKADIEKAYSVEQYRVTNCDQVSLFIRLQKAGFVRGRVLFMHPSTKQVELIAKTLGGLGYVTKAMHSGDRALPDDPSVHIAITQIGDAGVNIPGVTMVIDSGLTMTNSEGELIVKQLDSATMEQRAGRGGRFCDALYFVMCGLDDTKHKHAPSLDKALAGSPLADQCGVTTSLDRHLNPSSNTALAGDIYATCTVPWATRKEYYSISLMHHLIVTGKPGMGPDIYHRVAQGMHVEDAEYFMNDVLKIDASDLIPADLAIELYRRTNVVYKARKVLKAGRVGIRRMVLGVYSAKRLVWPKTQKTRDGGVKFEHIGTIGPGIIPPVDMSKF